MKKACSRLGWGLTGMALVTVIVQTLLVLAIAFYFPEFEDSPFYTLVIMTISFYLLGFGAFRLIIGKGDVVKEEPREKLTAARMLKLFVMCMGAVYMFNIVGMLVNWLISSFSGYFPSNPLDNIVDVEAIFISFLLTVVCAPLIEEAVFRGFMLSRTQRFGKRGAVWMTAICFGLVHMNLSQFFYAVATGVVFGYVRLKTGSIKPTILLHAAVNFVGSVFMPMVAVYMGEAGSIISVATLFIFLISGLILLRREWSWLTDVGPDIPDETVIETEDAYAIEAQPETEGGIPREIRNGVYFDGVRWVNMNERAQEPGKPNGKGATALEMMKNPGMSVYVAICLLMIVSTFFAV